MRIEHDELVAHLHQARRERLKRLYAILGELVTREKSSDAAAILAEIQRLEKMDIFQQARDVAADLAKLEEKT